MLEKMVALKELHDELYKGSFTGVDAWGIFIEDIDSLKELAKEVNQEIFTKSGIANTAYFMHKDIKFYTVIKGDK